MEIIIFTGLQASGKTTFYLQRFFRTHLHVSLDVLKTRRRERAILEACLKAGQRFVVDNTNPTPASRAAYIALAKAHHFRVVSYYFQTDIAAALARNALRPGKEQISEIGIRTVAKRLQPPAYSEGFDALFVVRIGEKGEFVVKEIPHEI